MRAEDERSRSMTGSEVAGEGVSGVCLHPIWSRSQEPRYPNTPFTLTQACLKIYF